MGSSNSKAKKASKNAQKKAGKDDLAKRPSMLGKGLSDISTDYDIGRVLGRGAFGTTRLVNVSGDPKKLYACKSIAKRKLTHAEDIEDVRREIQIMHHLKGHKNVTYVVGTYEDTKNIHLVMDLCSGGELFDRIVAKGKFSEKDAAALMRTIVGVVAHCHALGVIHRDLKPENFLLDSPADDAELKCTDFGLSSYFKPGEKLTDICGSPFYIAPEVLDRKYGPEADIWSCGVIMYVLLSGCPPFYGETEDEIFEAIHKGAAQGVSFSDDMWKTVSEPAKDCIRAMLTADPKKRATADEILQHEWMKVNGVASSKPLGNALFKRMGKFATANKLKREAIHVIARNLPSEEIAGLMAFFQALDDDNSGTVTVKELWDGLKAKGESIDLKELEELVGNMDLDGSGTIDYEEFVAATLSQHQLQNEESLLTAFKHFDTNNDGKISIAELRAGLENGLSGAAISDAEIDQVLADVDKDGSGDISYAEFVDMIMDVHEAKSRVTLTASKTKKLSATSVRSRKFK